MLYHGTPHFRYIRGREEGPEKVRPRHWHSVAGLKDQGVASTSVVNAKQVVAIN